MLDRRTYPRRHVIFGGTIKDARARLECRVRNLSQSGANVEVPATARIPEKFLLAIPKAGRALLARIVWRRADRAGLEFEPAAAGAAPQPDLEERLRISEKKARALKQRIRQLLNEG